MTVTVANTANTNQVFTWRTRTNEIAYALSTKVVTVDSNAAVGNAVVTGTFQANVLAASNVGSISGNLTFTTNVTATARVNLGAGANVMITTGNSTHRVLVVNSAGSFSLLATKITHSDLSDANVTSPANGQFLVWANAEQAWKNQTVVTSSVGGANTYIQFNDSDVGGGEANLTWDKATSRMTLGANGKISVGNSTVNAVINSTSSSVSNSTLNIKLGPGQLDVGSNVNISATRLFIGNSTVNAVHNSSIVTISNSTVGIIVQPLGVTVDGTDAAVFVGGSSITLTADGVGQTNNIGITPNGVTGVRDDGNFTLGGPSIHLDDLTTSNAVVNATGLTVANSTLTLKVGPSTINVGTTVGISTVDIKVGNSTVNATMNSSTFKVQNSTAVGTLLIPTVDQAANNNYYLNANGSWSGPVAMLDVSDQVVSGGARINSLSLGVVNTGTLTPDPGDRPMQHYTANGAHTLAPGSNAGSYLLDILNGASAGIITTSGWTFVTGDSLTTTAGHKFRCSCSIGNNGSLLVIQAMQ